MDSINNEKSPKNAFSINNMTENDKTITAFRKVLPQFLAVLVKNLLLIAYGMTLGFPTIAIPSLRGDKSRSSIEGELVLNKEQISWIGSINLITVPLGCLLSGLVTQPIGRRRSMQLLNFPLITAWLLFHYSKRVELLYLALCITGTTGGLLEAPVLTYVAEITEPYLRGMLSATSTMAVILGILVQFLLGTFLNWRTVALINIVFPVAAAICLQFIPESPHWLIMKRRYDDAKKSLCWLRGWCSVEEIIPEFNEIYNVIHKEHPPIENKQNKEITNSHGSHQKSHKFILKHFMTKTFYIPYSLVCFSFFLGNFCGMSTLQTYAVEIFNKLEAPIDKYYATLILGVAELTGTLLCVLLIHYTGKRRLNFFSLFGTGVCFIVVGTYTYLQTMKHDNQAMDSLSNTIISMKWIPTTFLIAAAFLSHVGIRLLPWILIGEVFTSEARANASGLSGGAGYIFGFLANKLFFTMTDTLTWAGTFWFYGFVALIGTILLYITLPETEGKPLSEIQLHFAGIQKLRKSVRRHTSKTKEQNVATSNNGNIGLPEKVILESEMVDTPL